MPQTFAFRDQSWRPRFQKIDSGLQRPTLLVCSAVSFWRQLPGTQP